MSRFHRGILVSLVIEGRHHVTPLMASGEEGYLSMNMHRFARVLAVLLLAGCSQTWQAPAGMSPEAQASDRAACEEEARQAAAAQTGSGTDAEVARLQTLTQCLEAHGWRVRRQAP